MFGDHDDDDNYHDDSGLVQEALHYEETILEEEEEEEEVESKPEDRGRYYTMAIDCVHQQRTTINYQPPAVNVRQLAYQLFDKMIRRVSRESQHIQLLKLSKSWHFKYKSKPTGDVNLWYKVLQLR
ncbi:hypothetical protein Bca101_084654 [Brassica carinata]